MSIRTLVLGSSGFLGSQLVELLAREAERAEDEAPAVLAASRAPRWHAPARLAPSSRRALEARVRARVLDARDPDALERLLAEEEPRRVVCCAALTSLAACDASPDEAHALNAALPRTLARWSAASGARLVHVSTDLVFGASAPPPAGFAEHSPTGPLSLYGASKRAGEEALLELDPAALVVRLPLLYGDSGGRERGASDALLAALARGERPALFRDERRSPLHVRDAARALLELASLERAGLLHVGGPDRLTRYDLGLLVLCAQGRRASDAARLVRAATRAEEGLGAERPADTCLDSTLARAFLAAPLSSVAQALAQEHARRLDEEIERAR